MRKGLTLIELTITVVMFAILAVVTVYVFRAILISWSGEETRAGIDISLDRGMEETVRELRRAKNIQSINDDEIRFTIEENGSDVHYIYYLYNEEDSYPPNFAQDSYELRKAALSGSISGTFTYGAGQIILTSVIPPGTGDNPRTDLSIDIDNLITIILKINRGDETVNSKTQVMPRNL